MRPHETTMQSTVVIKCKRSTGGFRFTESQFVTILNITLTDCAAVYYLFNTVCLGLENLFNTHLRHISICNSSGAGLLVLNCFNITIEDCSFFYNQFPVDELFGFGVNIQVVYSGLTQHSIDFNKLKIVRSNFSFSLGRHLLSGSGLSIFSVQTNMIFSLITLWLMTILVWAI